MITTVDLNGLPKAQIVVEKKVVELGKETVTMFVLVINGREFGALSIVMPPDFARGLHEELTEALTGIVTTSKMPERMN